MYEPGDYGPLLVGQTRLADKAVGQEVELGLGPRADVQMQISAPDEAHPRRFAIVLTNALAGPVDVELSVPFELRRGKGFAKVDGVPTWQGSIAANSERRLSFEISKPAE